MISISNSKVSIEEVSFLVSKTLKKNNKTIERNLKAFTEDELKKELDQFETEMFKKFDSILEENNKNNIKTTQYTRSVNEQALKNKIDSQEKKISNFSKIFEINEKKDKILKEDNLEIIERLSLIENNMGYFNEQLNGLTTHEDILNGLIIKKAPEFLFVNKRVEEVEEATRKQIEEYQEATNKLIQQLIACRLEEEGKKVSHEIKRDFANLKESLEELTFSNMGFRDSIEITVADTREDLNRNLREISEDIKSNLKKMDLTIIEIEKGIKSEIMNKLDSEVENLQKIIKTLTKNTNGLMNDQEAISKETSDLFNDICLKMAKIDERFDITEVTMERINEAINENSKPKIDVSEFITFEYLNDYYSKISTTVGEKVSIQEVQSALNQLQRKINLELIKLKKGQAKKFIELTTNLSEKLAQNFNKSPQVAKENIDSFGRSQNNQDSINSKPDIPDIIEELEIIRREVDMKLTENDFENYLSLNKNSLSEMQENLSTKVDESEMQDQLGTKAGKNNILIRFGSNGRTNRYD